MHYYTFNIKDWTQDTAHLSVEEEGVYRRLIDHYYDSEQPIPADTNQVIRKLRLRGHEEIVASILDEYFHLESDGYHHTRCDKGIAAYHQQQSTASKAGKASAAKRALDKNSTTVERPLNDRCFDVEHDGNDRSSDVQPTNNHKPITNNQERVARKRGYTLREWLAKNDEEGRDDIPADGCVMAYANNLHIPAELVVIAWYAYVDKYVKERKRYANWDLAFLNCVKDGGYGIWRRTPDGYVLTTKGLQAETAMLAEEKAKIGENGIQALQAI